MITQLRLHNFKSWEDTGDIQFAPITGFFGANSSGKTSLLQALLMMKQTVASPNRATVLNLGHENDYVLLGTYRDVVYCHADHRPIKVSLSWKNGSNFFYFRADHEGDYAFANAASNAAERRYQLSADYLSDRITTQMFSYEVDQFRVGMERVSHTPNRDTYRFIAEGFVPALGEVDEQYSGLLGSYQFPPGIGVQLQQRQPQADTLHQLSRSLSMLFEETYYLGPLRERSARAYPWKGTIPSGVGIRGERTIEALIASRLDKKTVGEIGHPFIDKDISDLDSVQERVAGWLQKLGLIHSFDLIPIPEIESYRVEVRVTPDAAPVSLTAVGFGVSQVLPVLVLCQYVPRGSTLILEQPELHLHPSVQSGLADVFIDVAQNRDLQIILESHSEHLLRRLQRRIAEEKLAPEQTALYFTSLCGGRSHLEQLQIDKYGNILNWPENFFGDEMGDLVAMTEAAIYRQN